MTDTYQQQLLPPDLDQPEVAFAAMTRKLAGLTAAIEGFASRQQELHARDYGPDLARIRAEQELCNEAIRQLEDRPAMKLTPQLIGSQIEAAGAKGRAGDHQAWANAQNSLGHSIQSISAVVASAMAARVQKQWIAGAAAAALCFGYMLGDVIPERIDQLAPESWYWPEQRAAATLDRNGWDAGIRMMQVYSPRDWRALEQTRQMLSENVGPLADCQARAANIKQTVSCRLDIRPSHQAWLPKMSQTGITLGSR